MHRWCKNPPKDVQSMAMSPDGRYVYCLGQTVFVFDRETGAKQRLPAMGNTVPFLSPDGRFLGGVHPSRTSQDTMEVTLWRVGETHEEAFPRVKIRSQIPPFHPCFTADGAYILLDAHPFNRRTQTPMSQLWAVSTADGSARMVHEFGPDESIWHMDSGPHGVLVSIHSRADNIHHQHLLLFTALDEPPCRIDLSLASPLFHMDMSACWLPDGQVLMQYHQGNGEPGVHLQRLALPEKIINPASQQFIPCIGPHVVFSPDGQYAALHRGNPVPPEDAPDKDNLIVVCRMNPWQQTFAHPCEYLPEIRFSPDSQWLLVSGEEPLMEPRESWQ